MFGAGLCTGERDGRVVAASRSRGCDMVSARSSVSWPRRCSSRYRHLFRCAFVLFQARDLKTRRPSPLSIGASSD
jgi:hypothetical protein